MTSSVQTLLAEFDQLPEADQREAAAEILRRVRVLNLDPVSDNDLVVSAEGLFLELDRAEDANERP